MKHEVKYQLERAQDALRTALKLGAEKEDSHLLSHIARAVSDIDSWMWTFIEPQVKINTDKYPVPVSLYNTDTIGNINITTEKEGDQIKYTFS